MKYILSGINMNYTNVVASLELFYFIVKILFFSTVLYFSLIYD